MTSLFISYSRKDIESARKLTEAFKGQELDFWIDWEGIPPTVDWWKEIEKGIEEADIFLFLISPDSIRSKICKQEIETAVKNGKRLIPLVVRDIKGDEALKELSLLNWIFLREDDNFDVAFNKLITAIRTDYEWTQTHRQLQVKALEWERSGYERSFLLRGKELQDAEFQLITNTSKEPHPTDLQRKYAFKSRQATDKQRRINTSITIAGVIVLAGLAVFGFTQAGLARNAQATAESNASIAQTAQADAEASQKLAEERAKVSRAGELAAEAVRQREEHLNLSLLLGMEAYNTHDNTRTRGVLLDNVITSPHLLEYVSGLETNSDYQNLFSSAALSPDDQTLAVGNRDGSITLYNLIKHKVIGRLSTNRSGSIDYLAFSPDGKILAAGGYAVSGHNNTIILWDMSTHQPIGEPLSGHQSYISSIAYSPDGTTLASGSDDNTIILWDAATRQPIGQPLSGHDASVRSLAFFPHGTKLVSGSWDSNAIIWDISTHMQIGILTDENGSIDSVAVSPDGEVIATGGYAGINLWDAHSFALIGSPLVSGAEGIYSLAFSPTDQFLVSGSSNKMVDIWDLSTSPPTSQSLTGHTGEVYNIAFNPTGEIFASVGQNNDLLLWKVRTSEKLTSQKGTISSIVFSPDGKTFASGSWDNTIVLWDASTHEPIGVPLIGHTEDVNTLAFSPDGKILASGSGFNPNKLISELEDTTDNSIIFWNTATQHPIGQSFIGKTGSVLAIAFNPTGEILASGDTNNNIILWKVESREPIKTPLAGHASYVSSLAFSPDGKILASGSYDNTIILWDVALHQPVEKLLSDRKVAIESLAFSPDGKILASGNRDGSIVFWDTVTYQPVGQPLLGHTNEVYSIAFHPTETILASGSSDMTTILWDTTTHKPIGQPLKGHTSAVEDVAFNPDGKTLASTSWDWSIMVWDIDLNSWLDTSCQRAGRNLSKEEWDQFFPDEEYRITCPQWPAGE